MTETDDDNPAVQKEEGLPRLIEHLKRQQEKKAEEKALEEERTKQRIEDFNQLTLLQNTPPNEQSEDHLKLLEDLKKKIQDGSRPQNGIGW